VEVDANLLRCLMSRKEVMGLEMPGLKTFWWTEVSVLFWRRTTGAAV
jgi:hypothetical protein